VEASVEVSVEVSVDARTEHTARVARARDAQLPPLDVRHARARARLERLQPLLASLEARYNRPVRIRARRQPGPAV
jgi:hypothetical protein